MKRANLAKLLTIICISTFFAQASASMQLIGLGTIGGDSSCAYSINNNGQVVGQSQDSSGNTCAVLFNPAGSGINTYLGALNGVSGIAHSIGNTGQIVGESESDGNTSLTSPNGTTLFDQTGNGNNVSLGGIDQPIGASISVNNAGKIVGVSSFLGAFYSHATLFDPTGNQANIDLGTLGGDQSLANSINNSNQIVGWASNNSWQDRACLFDFTGGKANTDLGTLGGDESTANYINDLNQIFGWAENSSGMSRATLFDYSGNGNNIDLGTLGGDSSEVSSANNFGQAVGWAENAAGESVACLFDITGNGNNIDLNTLIDPSTGWTLTHAYDINDNGWIVGQGINADGNTTAFLLTPEPTTILLLTLGAIAIKRKNKRAN